MRRSSKFYLSALGAIGLLACGPEMTARPGQQSVGLIGAEDELERIELKGLDRFEAAELQVESLHGFELTAEQIAAAVDAPPPRSLDQHGRVSFNVIASDCGGGPEQFGEQYAWVRVEGDALRISLPGMPVLSGQLLSDRAEIDGLLTFRGSSGAEVTCDVDGHATLGAIEVEGEVTEVLSSVGDLNCTSTYGYRIVLDG